MVEAASASGHARRRAQKVAKTGDTAAIQAFAAANQPKVQEAQKVAGAYGLKVCGNGR